MSYVVEVNECHVLASQWGAEWWGDFRKQYDPIGRIADTAVSIAGNRCEVACDDREHADWLAGHMVDHGGLPKSAVKVRKAVTA